MLWAGGAVWAGGVTGVVTGGVVTGGVVTGGVVVDPPGLLLDPAGSASCSPGWIRSGLLPISARLAS